jgi:hypothetical protein
MKRIGAMLVGLVGLLMVAGCPATESEEPVVGDWRSRELVGGQHNVLTLEDDLRGDAVIYFYIEGSLYYAEFEVEVRDHSGDRYELDFECDGNCSNLSFTMDCTLRGEDMDCEGSDLFSEYDFEWERE